MRRNGTDGSRTGSVGRFIAAALLAALSLRAGSAHALRVLVTNDDGIGAEGGGEVRTPHDIVLVGPEG